MSKVITDRRLYLTSDGVLVEHGDPSAAFLWACEGREVAADVADAVGYRPATEAQDATGEVVEPEPGHVCDVCGFEAKSAGGLGAHQRRHD